MKAIFLDIDGVLATEASSKQPWHEDYSYPFDPNCVAVLNKILENSGAEIILSSDWRIAFNNDLELLDRLFKYNGVCKSPIDVTPDIGKNRDKEIESYLAQHSYKLSSFAIIDDQDLKIHPGNFVRTTMEHALNQPAIADRILEVLMKNS